MLPIRVLVSVFCLSAASAFAQDDAERMVKVLCVGDPECEAIGTYRLTAENLRKMFAVDRELFTLVKDVPDLQRRMEELARSIDPQRRLRELTLDAQVYEGIPEIAQVLRKHKTTGREYVFTQAVAAVTAMSDVSLGRNVPPSEFMTPALKFWRSMDPTLRAEADAWKKMRGYDKGINR